ncbi:Proteasome-activating nucleotidase [Methanofollis liminatans DSM 4140]|uniref:Proteasome-activating nucleotidase n=1 Tax=Methanofollis liminatans DSM 4140 TaxID=28892 RepID=J1L292_9EURY|nr:proteasome-activating nucleotidase [Methanofollis liminatans]EJG07167.1 Proteasome-activating nucleotidase [Methanofollis liminatans DSM 4140]
MGDSGCDITEPQNSEELCKYLLERISNLENRNLELRERMRQMESEKRYVETQKIRYEREMRKLRSEIEQLRSPPLVVGEIIDIIDNNRVVVRSSAGPRFLVRVSQFIDPKDLRSGSRCTLNQQSLALIEVLPNNYDPQIYGMELEERPGEIYSDIGGLEAQVQELKEAVELPLTKPHLFEQVGIRPPKGVLLYGPPGTGKTLLARAVAHETNAHFLRVVGSELVQKYIGEGARLVRELFEIAREKAPAIIFIDEIDAVGAHRTESVTSGDREVQRTLMQLLAGMDGFEARGDVKIIGATNRIDILDPALLRPGRFDRIIEIPLPDIEGRYSILKIHTKGMNLESQINLLDIAKQTEGRNGADLRAICMEAGMFAIRDERSQVSGEDFVRALHKVSTGFNRQTLKNTFGEMFA